MVIAQGCSEVKMGVLMRGAEQNNIFDCDPTGLLTAAAQSDKAIPNNGSSRLVR